MAYRFTDPSNFAYSSGSIFLGLDPETARPLGIETERHAITIGGAGAGKGATLLIPNARRWPHNLLCIDVKGENAAATWQEREALGQHVGVLDPYQIADVPDRLRVSINPLAGLDADMPTIAEDLRFIADGMIVRAKREDAGWDDGARDILAGLMAYIVAEAPPEQRTLSAMRRLLMQPNEVRNDDDELIGGLYFDAQHMAASDACGGLVAAAGVTLMAGIESESGRPSKFIEGARSATLWLDSAPMKTALGSSTFDLGELKRGQASLFLVLPPKYLASAAGFFRLFVQSAIAAMQSSARIERRCLFLLDEFHTLGKMEEISKAAGLMRGYGLHLWPFLQDLGQLHELYGATGSETFFGNADVAAFLGNGDVLTLEYISRRLGKLTPEEIAAPPDIETATATYATASPVQPDKPDAWFPDAHVKTTANENERRRIDTANENERRRVDLENAKRRAAYDHAMKRKGDPRLAPDELAPMLGKGHGDVVARSMIVFGPSGAVLNVRPAPYFAPPPEENPLVANAPAKMRGLLTPYIAGLSEMIVHELESGVVETIIQHGNSRLWHYHRDDHEALFQQYGTAQTSFSYRGEVSTMRGEQRAIDSGEYTNRLWASSLKKWWNAYGFAPLRYLRPLHSRRVDATWDYARRRGDMFSATLLSGGESTTLPRHGSLQIILGHRKTKGVEWMELLTLDEAFRR